LFLRCMEELGCNDTDSVYVIELDPPELDIFDDTACFDDIVTLIGTPKNDTALGNTDSAVYSWAHFQGGLNKSDVTDTNITLVDSLIYKRTDITAGDSGWYYLTYGIDQCIVNDSVYLNFYDLPIPEPEEGAVFCAESDGSIEINGGPAFEWEWYDDEEFLNIISNDSILEVFEQGNQYLRVWNQYGCSDTATTYVDELCPPRCHLHTAFSPNKDVDFDPDCAGNDDIPCPDNYFYVFCKHQKDFKLTVFSRWGEIIFFSEDRENVWDGTYRGKDMPSGVYPWTMEYNAVEIEFDRPKDVSGKLLIVS